MPIPELSGTLERRSVSTKMESLYRRCVFSLMEFGCISDVSKGWITFSLQSKLFYERHTPQASLMLAGTFRKLFKTRGNAILYQPCETACIYVASLNYITHRITVAVIVRNGLCSRFGNHIWN